MLRNPGAPGHAPLTRLLAVALLFTLGLATAGPLLPVLAWILALL